MKVKMSVFMVITVVVCIFGLSNSADHNGFKSNRRNLQAARAMKITVNYTDADKQWKSNTSFVDKYIFSKKLMAKTVDFYQTVLKVKYPKETNTFPDVDAGDGLIIKGRTMNFDLWVYFKAFNKQDSTFAAASPLYEDTELLRPIVGYVEVNLNAIQPSKANAINHFATFVHEFYHILVFNNQLYEKFIGSDKKPVGKTNLITENINVGGGARSGYKGTNVLNFAKIHLSDSTLPYVLMENDGGSGSANSHWEHKYWPNEFMGPVDTTPSIHSDLSLNMAIDSGWFEVNSAFAEELTYGKNAGGNFQFGGCQTALPGFCAATDAGKTSCPPDYRYKAKCYTDPTYTENCYFLFADVICGVDDTSYGNLVDSTFEKLGPDSKCVLSKKSGETANIARCAVVSCSGTGEITYNFKTTTCTCSTAQAGTERPCGDTVTRVTCPSSQDMSSICTRLQDSNKCLNDCNGNGLCLGKPGGTRTCFCLYGWEGTSCSQPSSTETEDKVAPWIKDGSNIIITNPKELKVSWIINAGILSLSFMMIIL